MYKSPQLRVSARGAEGEVNPNSRLLGLEVSRRVREQMRSELCLAAGPLEEGTRERASRHAL